MGYIEVHGADLAGDRITSLKVKIPNLPARAIDRDTAIRWMRDGHSLLPVANGKKLPALLLLDVGGEGEAVWVIRDDADRVAEDRVPALPSTAEADPDRVAASPAA